MFRAGKWEDTRNEKSGPQSPPIMYQQTSGLSSTLNGQSIKIAVSSFKIHFVITVRKGTPGARIRPEERFFFFFSWEVAVPEAGRCLHGTPRPWPWKIFNKEPLDLMEMR